jgi:hypothetical protein
MESDKLPNIEPLADEKSAAKQAKRKAALAKGRETQAKRRAAKKVKEEEDRISLKTIQGMLGGLHQRLELLERRKLMEAKQDPVKIKGDAPTPDLKSDDVQTDKPVVVTQPVERDVRGFSRIHQGMLRF